MIQPQENYIQLGEPHDVRNVHLAIEIINTQYS